MAPQPFYGDRGISIALPEILKQPRSASMVFDETKE